MGSDRFKATLAGLGLAACAAGVMATLASPRAAVALGLLGVGFAAWGWTLLGRLAQPRYRAEPVAPVATPSIDPLLEHVPVALWRVGEQVEALNVAARRLMAPGRVVDAPALRQQLQTARVGRDVITLETERGAERAVLAVSSAILLGQPWRLVALAPIESELETASLAAWQQLVQVLTHEIMNSLTPIASLAGSAGELLDSGDTAALREALDTIARRAAHLQGFVERYRSISQAPPPQREVVDLAGLLAAFERLMGPAWRAVGGELRVSVEPATLALDTDPAQLEQILINLARNALEACEGQPAPALRVEARLTRGARLRLTVSDNGPGIAPGLESRLFTPFVSTRSGNGRGMGLALVRQLVHGLGGTVRHARRPGGGACFVLSF